MKFTSLIGSYLELTKPRILSLVLVTTSLGFYLSNKSILSYHLLIYLLIGVSWVCAGSSALNHYLEREADACMTRTKNRPIPRGIISPPQAMGFGMILVLAGIFFLWWKVNLLTAFLSLLTSFLYVLVYTPMKKISWLNTTIGAIPGALPPLGGWAAGTGELSQEAWILFFILFFWQHPHFYSIAWMFKNDYKKAGFKMLPVVYPDGKSTFLQIIIYSMLLILTSLVPTLIGMAGFIYLGGALILGLVLLNQSLVLSASQSLVDAKKLLKTSIIYLPVIFILIVVDIIY